MYFLILFFFAAFSAVVLLGLLFIRANWSGSSVLRSTEPGPPQNVKSVRPWLVVKRDFTSPTGAKYSPTTIDYLRQSVYSRAYGTIEDKTDVMYGASFPVDTSVSSSLGFSRNLLGYTRKDVIYVPEISQDSKHCDDWMTPAYASSKFVPCSVSKGIDACFLCVESRKYVRNCVHVPHAFTVSTFSGDTVTIPASSTTGDVDQGWCLPSAFNNINFESNSPVPIQDKTRNCNPNTGSWILSQLGQDNGKFDSSYNWVCKCRYPSLMTNVNNNLLGDCLQPVGCAPHGQLDDLSKAAKVDPYVKGFCQCETGFTGGFDRTIGPICVEVNIVDFGLNNVWKNSLINTDFSVLNSKFISDKFLELFPAAQRDSLILPDPCKIDSFSGKKVTGCETRMLKISGKQVAFCVTLNENHVAHLTGTDYLMNNSGRYPNACLYTGSHSGPKRIGSTPDNVKGHYMLSYWNGKNLPDIGQTYVISFENVNQEVFELMFAFKKIIRDDPNYKDWVKREIKPSNLTDKIIPTRFDMDKYFTESQNGIVIYNEFPECDIEYKLANIVQVVPLFNKTLLEFYTGSQIVLSLVSNRDEKHWRHLYYRRIDQHTWLPQTADEYFKWKDNKGNCTGRGRLVPNSAVYLNYATQTSDFVKKRFHQRFLLPRIESAYPAYQSRALCTLFEGCEMYKTRADYLDEFFPSLSPSITIGNRDLIPFVRNKRFDATLQLFITDLFYIIAANAYSQNYRNYQGQNNKFALNPDGVRQFA